MVNNRLGKNDHIGYNVGIVYISKKAGNAMDETGTINLLFTMSGVAVLWRLVIYQGNEIIKLTKRQDKMWERCFGSNIDNAHIEE